MVISVMIKNTYCTCVVRKTLVNDNILKYNVGKKILITMVHGRMTPPKYTDCVIQYFSVFTDSPVYTK